MKDPQNLFLSKYLYRMPDEYVLGSVRRFMLHRWLRGYCVQRSIFLLHRSTSFLLPCFDRVSGMMCTSHTVHLLIRNHTQPVLSCTAYVVICLNYVNSLEVHGKLFLSVNVSRPSSVQTLGSYS